MTLRYRKRVGIVAGMILSLSLAASMRADDPLEEKFEHVYPLASDAALSIRNADGAIRIYGSDRPQLELHALKRAYTAARLQEIQIDVAATPHEVKIETRIPKKGILDLSDRSGTVDYVLVIPVAARLRQVELMNGELLLDGVRGGSAKVHLMNGWMGCHNCFENLDAGITNGRLDLVYDWWVRDIFTAKASAANGNLRAILPPVGPLSLHAESITGRISNALAAKTQTEGDRRRVSLILGSNDGATVNLSTTNGNIEIEKAYEAVGP